MILWRPLMEAYENLYGGYAMDPKGNADDIAYVVEQARKTLVNRTEQKRRLECLLAKHVDEDDEELSDADFIQTVVRRWGNAEDLCVSIGITKRKSGTA